MGALGIGGIPGWSGYVSKTLLHESIVEYIHGMAHGEFLPVIFTEGSVKCIEWIFLISGGLTVAYMCKLFAAVFLEENADSAIQQRYDRQKNYLNPVSSVALAVTALLIPVMGMLPHGTMDAMADMAQGFLGVHHAGHAVHYFTWVNLKGSLISISIGAALYFLVVRGWMMEKQASGQKIYVNRWPAWIDLEDQLYRPLLMKVLPGVLGFVCQILSGAFDRIVTLLRRFGAFLAGILDNITEVLTKILPRLGAAVAGLLDILVDGVVVLLRKTVYRDSQDHGELEEGNALTHVVGVSLNALEALLNKTIWRHHEHKKDLEHWFVLKYSAFKENSTIIGRSLSFGLVLFGIGLCVTLVYLLVAAFL